MHFALCSQLPDDDSLPAVKRMIANTKAVINSVEKAGHQVTIIDSLDQFVNKPFPKFDAGWIRIVPTPEIFQSEPPLYWQAALLLEEHGVPFLNSMRSQDIAANKLSNAIAFNQVDLPHPDTWLLSESLDSAVLPDKMICKPLFGRRAEGIAIVSSLQEALDHQSKLGNSCVIQQFVPSTRCIRVVSTPYRSVRIYEKRVSPENPIASIAQGADRFVLEDPGNKLAELGSAMVKAVGGELMGVDILADEDDKLWALEVNASFAFDPQDPAIGEVFIKELERLAIEGPTIRATA